MKKHYQSSSHEASRAARSLPPMMFRLTRQLGTLPLPSTTALDFIDQSNDDGSNATSLAIGALK